MNNRQYTKHYQVKKPTESGNTAGLYL